MSKYVSRYTINDCKNLALKYNGECLSDNYKNKEQKLRWRCKNNHEWEANFAAMIKRKKWCIFCGGLAYATQDVKNMFIKEGYTPLFNEYKNASQKLDFVCSNGHKYFIMLMSWNCGRRCAICAGRRVDINEVKEEIKRRGYILCGGYSGSHAKLDLICSRGHKFKITWDNFRAGHNCPNCRRQTSKAEDKLYKMIVEKYNGLEILRRDRKIIKPYEIDIAIPKYRIAIEYNGAGHHLPIYGGTEEKRVQNLKNTQNKDAIKKDMLCDKGWRFFWIDDKKSFDAETINRAFNWLDLQIQRVKQHDESLKAISLDDVGCY